MRTLHRALNINFNTGQIDEPTYSYEYDEKNRNVLFVL